MEPGHTGVAQGLLAPGSGALNENRVPPIGAKVQLRYAGWSR
jgi:hypothetical protein